MRTGDNFCSAGRHFENIFRQTWGQVAELICLNVSFSLFPKQLRASSYLLFISSWFVVGSCTNTLYQQILDCKVPVQVFCHQSLKWPKGSCNLHWLSPPKSPGIFFCLTEWLNWMWAAAMSPLAFPIQLALGACLCCGPAPLGPICLHRGAGEVSLVAQVQGVVFDLNIYIPDSGMQKVLQRKYHIQGWGRDLCSAQIPVCICSHLTFHTWSSEEHLAASNIGGKGCKQALSASEGNSCSARKFTFVVALLWNFLLLILFMSWDKHAAHTYCISTHDLALAWQGTYIHQLAVHVASLTSKSSAVWCDVWVGIQVFFLLLHQGALNQSDSINLSLQWFRSGLGVQDLLPYLASNHGVVPQWHYLALWMQPGRGATSPHARGTWWIPFNCCLQISGVCSHYFWDS